MKIQLNKKEYFLVLQAASAITWFLDIHLLAECTTDDEEYSLVVVRAAARNIVKWVDTAKYQIKNLKEVAPSTAVRLLACCSIIDQHLICVIFDHVAPGIIQ